MSNRFFMLYRYNRLMAIFLFGSGIFLTACDSSQPKQISSSEPAELSSTETLSQEDVEDVHRMSADKFAMAVLKVTKAESEVVVRYSKAMESWAAMPNSELVKDEMAKTITEYDRVLVSYTTILFPAPDELKVSSELISNGAEELLEGHQLLLQVLESNSLKEKASRSKDTVAKIRDGNDKLRLGVRQVADFAKANGITKID